MTPPPAPAAPLRADCIGDSAGRPDLRLAAHGDTAAALLVLRRRAADDEVFLPLAPGAEGRPRAALPSSVALPEGRWDAYARVSDTRACPTASRGVWCPASPTCAPSPPASPADCPATWPSASRTPPGQGNLTVRSRLRAPHAQLTDGALTVRGRVYGTRLAPGAQCRAAPAARHRRGRHAPAGRRGRADRFRLHRAPRHPGVGRVGPVAAARRRARTARAAGAAAGRRRRQAARPHLPTRVRTPHGLVEAGPYCTRDDDLSVSVTAPAA